MRKSKILLAGAAVLALVTSCIVSDQITTLTIHPDGSADWVRFQSNIHSSEKGAKGEEELKRFIEDFDAGRDPDLARIREAGGEIREARWVRRQEPLATSVAARLPGASALLEFLTFRNDKGEVVIQPRFATDGQRRKLALAIRLPQDGPQAAETRPTESERRQQQADGLSVTRIAVRGGRIIDERGFTVAGDKQSALLDPDEVQDLLKRNGGQVEIFLEWELGND